MMRWKSHWVDLCSFIYGSVSLQSILPPE